MYVLSFLRSFLLLELTNCLFVSFYLLSACYSYNVSTQINIYTRRPDGPTNVPRHAPISAQVAGRAASLVSVYPGTGKTNA